MDRAHPIVVENLPQAAIDGSFYEERALRNERHKLLYGFRTPARAVFALDLPADAFLRFSAIVHPDETIEVPSVGDRPPRRLARQTLAEVVEPRYEELLTLIQGELRRSGYEDLVAGGVVTFEEDPDSRTRSVVIVDGDETVFSEELPVRARLRVAEGQKGGMLAILATVPVAAIGSAAFGSLSGSHEAMIV